MALVPCTQCRQPFYAACHDGSCLDVLCPYCTYAEISPDELGATAPLAADSPAHRQPDSVRAGAAPRMADSLQTHHG